MWNPKRRGLLAAAALLVSLVPAISFAQTGPTPETGPALGNTRGRPRTSGSAE